KWAAFGFALCADATKVPEQRRADLDPAFACLEQAVASGYRDAEELETDPDFDPPRRDDRYAPLLAKLKTPWGGNAVGAPFPLPLPRLGGGEGWGEGESVVARTHPPHPCPSPPAKPGGEGATKDRGRETRPRGQSTFSRAMRTFISPSAPRIT